MFSSSNFGISDFTEVFDPFGIEVFDPFGIEFVHVSNVFFTMITFTFPCIILFKDIVFPIAYIFNTNRTWIRCTWIWALHFVPLTCVSVSVVAPCCLHYSSSAIWTWCGGPSSIVLSVQGCIGYLESFVLPYGVQNIISISVKNITEFLLKLYGICNLLKIVIFTILSVPINEHGRSFHFLISSIYFIREIVIVCIIDVFHPPLIPRLGGVHWLWTSVPMISHVCYWIHWKTTDF